MKYLHPVPNFSQLLSKHADKLLHLARLASEETNRTDAYRSWEEIRYRSGPEGISSEEWWLGIKFNRMQARQSIPLCSKSGKAFNYTINNLVMSRLHFIDSMAGGSLRSDSSTTLNRRNGANYLVTSLEEESIMSSILEGASVTRADAKSMLRENRNPNSVDEQMIANNYRTMQQIIAWKDEKLTPERLLSLHRLMTEGTLDTPAREGSWRQETDHVRIEEELTGEVIYMPPPAARVPQLMQSLCDFANDYEDGQYLHPVLKAIILHYWLAYVHPFTDGNGRTARTLFYWYMLRHDYWLFEYITISKEIRSKKNGRSYYDAFRHTEMDDKDLNYFISDQLLTISRAIESFYEYIRSKKKEQDALLVQLRSQLTLNARQREVVTTLLKDSELVLTFEAHANTFRVARQTARTDLLGLAELGYLLHQKQGRTNVFMAAPDLEKRLASAKC